MSGNPVDQTCGIQQRCCLIEGLLDVESALKTLLMKAGSGAGIGCAPYSRGLSRSSNCSIGSTVSFLAICAIEDSLSLRASFNP